MILLGLGSNLGDREHNLEQSLRLLTTNYALRILQVSSIYETAPFGFADQPDYLNQVAKVSTTLSAIELLYACLDVEKRMGRVRGTRWGPRIIDIDILCMDDIKMKLDILYLPHPGISQRKFVLIPICEIDPDAKIVDGKTACQLLERMDDRQEVRLWKLVRWNDEHGRFEN